MDNVAVINGEEAAANVVGKVVDDTGVQADEVTAGRILQWRESFSLLESFTFPIPKKLYATRSIAKRRATSVNSEWVMKVLSIFTPGTSAT